MKPDITEQLKKIDDLLREGKGDIACRKLGDLSKKKILRPHALEFASLAKRANLLNLALRVLNPIVRPSPKNPVVPTETEKAEYASSLALLGLSEEALTILKEIDSSEIPESLLYQSFALVSEWNYKNSIPLLLKYIASPKISSYQKLVGKVNLAAAYVHERLVEEASQVLNEIRHETKSEKLYRLYGNALELSAQNALSQKKWNHAEDFLYQSEKVLEATGTLEFFFVEKWKTILKVLKSQGDASSISNLHKLRSKAQKLLHWETVRDCDQFEVICRKDNKLLIPLYFGTPFESFRHRLLEDFGKDAFIPEKYRLSLGKEPGFRLKKQSKSGPILDLFSGEIFNKKIKLKPGQSLHRLFAALISDFYRPLRIPSLHTRVYPQEFFNPISSPDRLHQQIKRLRLWLKKSTLPVDIIEKAGYYFLSSKNTCLIQLTLSDLPTEKHIFHLKRLQQAWPEGKFSVQEAAQLLCCSASSLHRLLRTAQENGQITRHGHSSATKYSFILKTAL